MQKFFPRASTRHSQETLVARHKTCVPHLAAGLCRNCKRVTVEQECLQKQIQGNDRMPLGIQQNLPFPEPLETKQRLSATVKKVRTTFKSHSWPLICPEAKTNFLQGGAGILLPPNPDTDLQQVEMWQKSYWHIESHPFVFCTELGCHTGKAGNLLVPRIPNLHKTEFYFYQEERQKICSYSPSAMGNRQEC